MLSEILTNAKKIVIKIGSSTLQGTGGVSRNKVKEITEFVSELLSEGKQVIIVSSGAMLSGRELVKISGNEIKYKQALSAIGQVKLMQAYREEFQPYYIPIGQLLLSSDDLNDEKRRGNIINTISALVSENVIPVINENDTTSTAEISFGDNDILSAEITKLWEADLLLMLSDVAGVLKDGEVIEKILDINTLEIDEREKSSAGTGGIASKIEAGKRLLQVNIPMFLFSGKESIDIKKFQDGSQIGSLFTH